MNFNKRKAFTLVELLVVISIIALLMSILMPALNRAKQQAEGILCRNNLRSLGQGIFVYAQNNDDKIPPRYTGGWVGTNPNPHVSYYAFDIRVHDRGKMVPLQLGKLYGSGIIAEPKVFYCPSQKEGDYIVSFAYKTYESGPGGRKWGEFIPPGQFGNVRTSYTYWTYGYGDAKGAPVPSGYTKLSQFGNLAIITDCIVHWDVIPHKKNYNTPQGLNVLFTDGHVTNCKNQDIYDNTLWNRNGAYDDGPGNHKEAFKEIMRLINQNP